MMRRLLCIAIVASVPFLFSACISREVQVPILLTPMRDATVEELVGILSQFQAFQTLTARLDVQFQSEREREQGMSRRYRTAEGRLVLARPGKMRLQIQVPVVKTNIAELASDGERFEVLVHPQEYRTFIQGTNGRRYSQTPTSLKLDERRREAGGFGRIRPEHFTEALLLPPVNLQDAHTIIVKEEFPNVENDPRPNVPKGQRIIRTYSVMSVIEHSLGQKASLKRRYWFDRTRNLLLVRTQIYGDNGDLLAEVDFDDIIRPPQADGYVPTRIHIKRPHDDYSALLRLDAGTVSVNVDIPPQAFKLEKPPDWGDTVETIDLDKVGSP
jgi:hypothetical protein